MGVGTYLRKYMTVSVADIDEIIVRIERLQQQMLELDRLVRGLTDQKNRKRGGVNHD
jgi:hypothetical protein